MFANNQENIPFHLAIFSMAFMIQTMVNSQANKGKESTRALTALVILYTVLRTFYTIFYALAIQPFRSIVFVLSQLVMAGVCIIIMHDAFNYNQN